MPRGSSATRARSSDAARRTSSSTNAPGSQAGLITIVANYEGEPEHVLGTAPIYNMETVCGDEAARLAFVAPDRQRADHRSRSTVRSDTDYGLRMTVNGDLADDRRSRRRA